MRGGHDGGGPIRPSLWCRRDESYIFSDFLRRNAGTNSTAGTSFDFLAGFTAFIYQGAGRKRRVPLVSRMDTYIMMDTIN